MAVALLEQEDKDIPHGHSACWVFWGYTWWGEIRIFAFSMTDFCLVWVQKDVSTKKPLSFDSDGQTPRHDVHVWCFTGISAIEFHCCWAAKISNTAEISTLSFWWKSIYLKRFRKGSLVLLDPGKAMIVSSRYRFQESPWNELVSIGDRFEFCSCSGRCFNFF